MEQTTKVHIKTNFGNLVLELFPDKAPKSVDNFLKYVRAGFYKDTLIHRVISNFIIQGGGFGSEMVQKATYPPISNEAKNGLRNERGTIALARTNDPHSATSQFFINLADNDFLNYTSSTPGGWGYCVFGHVIESMHVAETISGVPTGSRYGFENVPLTDVFIEKVQAVKA
ncbi:MAG: peptidylprolyl isomerase [Acidiferrobacterales bacterium]